MSLSAPCRVFDVQRFSIHDGPGIRTTVFLAGCPLRCAWCQNPEGFDRARAPELGVAEVLAEVLKDRDYYGVSGGGLTLSGGEPLLDPVAARALLAAAKDEGLHTCVQTSGAVPWANVEPVLGLVDLFQVDLKHLDPGRHESLTGVGPARIHQNVDALLARGAALQLRLPLVPGVNDGDEHLDAVARFLLARGVAELRLVPYHRLYLEKYARLGLEPRLPRLQPPSAAVLERVTLRLSRHRVRVALDGEAPAPARAA